MTVIGGISALAASGASAQETGGQQTGVFREADAAMTCTQIGDEAAQLSEAMGEQTPSGGWLSSLGNLAKAGAAMVIPGGGLAVAGVDAVRQPGADRAEAEEAALQHRWYYLNGLHAGRGCREAAQAASEPTVSAPPPPTPAAATADVVRSPQIQPASMSTPSGVR